MRIALGGAVFLASLVVTGWTALAWVLTPTFLLAALPLPAGLQTKRFYRRVTRFMCVDRNTHSVRYDTDMCVDVLLLLFMCADNGRGWAKWCCCLVR